MASSDLRQLAVRMITYSSHSEWAQSQMLWYTNRGWGVTFIESCTVHWSTRISKDAQTEQNGAISSKSISLRIYDTEMPVGCFLLVPSLKPSASHMFEMSPQPVNSSSLRSNFLNHEDTQYTISWAKHSDLTREFSGFSLRPVITSHKGVNQLIMYTTQSS